MALRALGGIVVVLALIAAAVFIFSSGQGVQTPTAQALPTTLPIATVGSAGTLFPAPTAEPSPAVVPTPVPAPVPVPQRFTISGKVFDAQTGVPLAGFAVSIYFSSPDFCTAGWLNGPIAKTKTGPDGTYELTGLAPGTYILVSAGAGYFPQYWRNGKRCVAAEELAVDQDLKVEFALHKLP